MHPLHPSLLPTLADSSEGDFGDAIDIRLDVVHPIPVAAVAFPAVTIVAILASHGEAIRGIHEIRTCGAINTVTRNQERRTRRELEAKCWLSVLSQCDRLRELQEAPGVMDAPTIPVCADSSKGNFEDDIDIGLDVAHPVPVAADAFPAVTIAVILANHGEANRGIHEFLQGVPIKEEMSTLRFRMGMAEAENASLCSKIRTMEAIETVTRSQERRTHMEMERQLAPVQESQRQDRENYRKLQELVTSQLGRHP
ncbi:hypothetical protein Tco_0749460 [Tanacetum coccineum]|uniref:Uncharacterized protein n=1 Tax=Tanacetum coccineum TaxID=301880 RepID=A0ABQ4YYJ7_9ASTR